MNETTKLQGNELHHNQVPHAGVHDADPAQISGYDYGRTGSAHSPLSVEELRQLEQCVGWNDEDAQTLQRHGEIFKNHAE